MSSFLIVCEVGQRLVVAGQTTFNHIIKQQESFNKIHKNVTNHCRKLSSSGSFITKKLL